MSDDHSETETSHAPNQGTEPKAEQAQNRPIKVFRDGDLKTSIWRNEGKHSPMYKTRLSKLYEDQEGNMRETQSLDPIDLLKSMELNRKSYVFIAGCKRQDREKARQQSQKHDKKQDRKRTPEQSQ